MEQDISKSEFVYRLNSKIGKRTCPSCGRVKCFSLYVYTDTGEPVGKDCGKCDHVNSCNYHMPPKLWFEKNGTDKEHGLTTHKAMPAPPALPRFIFDNNKYVLPTLKLCMENNLTEFLASIYGEIKTMACCMKLSVGSSKGNKTVFWQRDVIGNFVAGKIMNYFPASSAQAGHRTDSTTWAHSLIKNDYDDSRYRIAQQFFGLFDALNHPDKSIMLLESEKSAMVCSLHYGDNFSYIASGGCQGLTMAKFEPLKGRHIIFMPDSGKEEEWSEKAKNMSSACHFSYNVVTLAQLAQKFDVDCIADNMDVADLLLPFDKKAHNDGNKDLSPTNETLVDL